MISEKNDAASMTPAAKPSSASCVRTETLRPTRIGRAPTAVIRPATRLSTAPSRNGLTGPARAAAARSGCAFRGRLARQGGPTIALRPCSTRCSCIPVSNSFAHATPMVRKRGWHAASSRSAHRQGSRRRRGRRDAPTIRSDQQPAPAPVVVSDRTPRNAERHEGDAGGDARQDLHQRCGQDEGHYRQRHPQ